MHGNEDPTKNVLIGHRETSCMTQRDKLPVLTFIPISKNVLKNLVGFHCLLRKIPNVKSLESRFRWLQKRNLYIIYPHATQKSRPKLDLFDFFLHFLRGCHLNLKK